MNVFDEKTFVPDKISTHYKMILKMNATILFIFFISVQGQIYLYDTHDSLEAEYYDCIFVQSLYYCRRPQPIIDLIRDNDTLSCQYNNGTMHRFTELQFQKINISTILHEWKSSIERVEQYARFLRNPSQADEYICQCTEQSSFGKNCEYRLPIGIMFSETLKWQADVRKNARQNEQIYGTIVCYETLTCDSGLLCLDWREICDGIQKCMHGYDEENCDLLEMNICDDDEYRCMNGMCIPDECFLDGELDCLDWSDEMPYKRSTTCPKETASAQCEDHMCPPNQWSCGDGQCIPARVTSLIQQEYSPCDNERDQYYMCEIHPKAMKWTMPDGKCFTVSKATDRQVLNTTEEDKCQYMLRCALSRGGHINCPCWQNHNCIERLAESCSMSLIPYPQRPLVTAFIGILYNRSRDWYEKLPSLVFINGTIKCRDSLIYINRTITFHRTMTVRQLVQDLCINQSIDISPRCYHTNESTDVCHDWNPCMSITRLNDGFINCLNKQDESIRPGSEIEMSCLGVKQHRFRCSTKQPTCLSIMTLGNGEYDCQNTFDEFWSGENRQIAQMKCNANSKDDCALLRRYIEQSWITRNKSETFLKERIPFRFYCNTFWDLESAEDENITECQQWWICDPNQVQCETGQCIEEEWGDDYYRDCADGSDVKHVYLEQIGKVLKFLKLDERSDNQSYVLLHTCHSDGFFLCLSPQISSPQFVCLNQSQLGDGKIDCAGAVDESHISRHCSSPSTMLGNHFRCASTNTCIPYLYHCQENYRCPDRSDDESWCSKRTKALNCEGENDFACFVDQCISLSRCNEFFECPFGEDEYMCDYESSSSSGILPYRALKQSQARTTSSTFQLPRFPSNLSTSRFNQMPANDSVTGGNLNKKVSPSFVFRCNRGIGVWSSNNSTACFCPPQYYGDKCQYHADRLSVLVHLNLSQSIYNGEYDTNVVLQLLIVLLFENEALMAHEFHVRPALEINTFEKKIVHFIYSHSNSSRELRRTRFSNRSAIVESQPHSIRIEAYENRRVTRPSLVAVWQFPIYFDYIPVYRFAKILHLTKSHKHDNLCASKPCPLNAQCQPLMNNPTEQLCLCKANFYGTGCAQEDKQCANGYCAGESICKPNFRRSYLPYCLCSSNRYGDRCDLEYESCQSNPCLNGGSCFSTEQLDQVLCGCRKEFYGLRCELTKSFIRLSLETNHPYVAGVMQLFDIDSISLDLVLVQQNVFRTLPQLIEYYREGTTAPTIVLMKLYSSIEQLVADFYLLSVYRSVASVEGRTQISSINQCSPIHQLFKDSSPIKYHEVCFNQSKLLCFHDDAYLCLCTNGRRRAECFLYDHQLDQCSHCLADGRCLRGDHSRFSDFLCLCPPCYSGRQCQFSTKLFAFTLDHLLYTDLMSSQNQRTIYLLLLSALLGFLFAIPNNLCSFVTLRRKACLRFGIGYYLLWLSVINQINLGLFLARLTHIVTNTTTTNSASILNSILCKLFNYLLVSSSRIVFWLSALIAMERVYTAFVLNGRWLRQPYVARRLMVFSIIGILLAAVYEFLFYQSLFIANERPRSICILEFPMTYRPVWMMFHVLISTFSTLFPILVNLCSTITISLSVVKRKMNTLKAKRQISANQSTLMNLQHQFRFIFDVLRENKELVIGPGITLIPQLFSLPFFVSSFTLNCQNIENSWLRYLLIASYWTSFTPQMISFFLYISPSSCYSDEWGKTTIGHWIKRLF